MRGISNTRAGARQLVTHGHISVNGKNVNIASYQLKPGDVVEVREKSKSLEVIVSSIARKNNRWAWLEVDKATLSCKFLHYPERADIPEKINEQLIVELYSK